MVEKEKRREEKKRRKKGRREGVEIKVWNCMKLYGILYGTC